MLRRSRMIWSISITYIPSLPMPLSNPDGGWIGLYTWLGIQAYNDKPHRNPHRQPPPRLLAEYKCEYTSRETSEIIYRDNDPLEARRGMVERVEEILVSYDPAEDALVVAEEHERKLACDGDGGAQLEAAPEPGEFGEFEHGGLGSCDFSGWAHKTDT